MHQSRRPGVGEVLARVEAALDGLDAGGRETAGPGERLEWLAHAQRLSDRLDALTVTLAAEAERADAAMVAVGCSLRSWLADRLRLTARGAGALIARGRRLSRHPATQTAALTGGIRAEQARVITDAVDRLPDQLSTSHTAAGEDTLLGYADQFDATGLARLASHLVEVVAPEVADQFDARRLERDQRLAERDRHLTFVPDGHGSTLIRGQLPTLTAEPLIRILDSWADHTRRTALDRHDPASTIPSKAARRADALVTVIQAHQSQQLAPSSGGDRPRLIVTIDHTDLTNTCTKARVLATGERLTPGQLRQLACDADLLPAVLAGPSTVLDVGRDHRLVPPTLRLALTLRDQGCAFPGCDTPSALCHAHHLIPWQAGGPTALTNLVLLCPHHHGIVEPGHDPTLDRWTIHLDPHGLPYVTPPHRADPAQRPRYHHRYHPPPPPADPSR